MCFYGEMQVRELTCCSPFTKEAREKSIFIYKLQLFCYDEDLRHKHINILSLSLSLSLFISDAIHFTISEQGQLTQGDQTGVETLEKP